MAEDDSQILLILLCISLGLLVLLLVIVIGISHRLRRVERRILADSDSRDDSQTSPSQAETSPGGAFEAFLDEDTARRNLPKGEQFAAYRKWRKEKGMNWSKS